MNKRGQGLSTNAIILIILGVIVLVIIAVGFMVGWDRIAPWIESNNVDTIVQQCGVACSTNSKYDFCSMERELKDSEKNEFKTSCAVFSVVPEFDKYGVENCNIDCELPCNEVKINEKPGESTTSVTSGQCTEFNEEEECKAKKNECVWTSAEKKCTGTYKKPADSTGKYVVTEVTNLNSQTNACMVPK